MNVRELIELVAREQLADALADQRRLLADIVRQEGDADADPRVTRKLHRLAAAFECGQWPGAED